MFVVTRAVIGLAALRCRLQFRGKRCRPLLPSEMTLLGELHRQCEGLGLPWLGKHWPTIVSRQARQRCQALRGLLARIRPAQGSRPTCRCTPYLAATLPRPTARAPRSAPSTGAAGSPAESARWCPEKRRRGGPARLSPACRARAAAAACGPRDEGCARRPDAPLRNPRAPAPPGRKFFWARTSRPVRG